MAKKRRKTALWMAALFLVMVAWAVAVNAQSQKDVTVVTKDGIGSFLADGKGMTLYYFKKDSPGKSVCVGPCVEKWPLFFVETTKVDDPLKSADFGTMKREDGKMQTTYKGWPLYYWFQDKMAGDTSGQGVNEVWYVVKP